MSNPEIFDFSLLSMAVANGNIETVKEILRIRSNPNCPEVLYLGV